jgi:hypothetical protein
MALRSDGDHRASGIFVALCQDARWSRVSRGYVNFEYQEQP